MKEILIYTIVTNNYDAVKPAPNYPGFRYWLFSDNEDLRVPGWETKSLPKSDNPIKQQRLLKINSFLHTAGFDMTIYIDGNMELVKNPAEFLQKYYTGGFLTTQHPKRSTIREEAREILRKHKDLPENVEKTLTYAEEIGYQDDLGLFETMVLVRDKSHQVAILEEKWAKLLGTFSHRDQLSLPIASFLTGVKVNVIPRTTTFSYMKRNRGHKISLKFRNRRNEPSGIFGPVINFIKGVFK
ncbi:MAG TPA: glycosyltransferase domain-containing protein [Algoriphagus sp.]|nr:glycosyltransferase domain-containing protein [Algoriphagus sp.]